MGCTEWQPQILSQRPKSIQITIRTRSKAKDIMAVGRINRITTGDIQPFLQTHIINRLSKTITTINSILRILGGNPPPRKTSGVHNEINHREGTTADLQWIKYPQNCSKLHVPHMSRLLSASLKNVCGLRTGSSRSALGKELRVNSSANSRFALRSEKAKCASGICKRNSATESLHLATSDIARHHVWREKVRVNMILQEIALTIQHHARFYGMNRAATLWNHAIST